MDGEQIKSGEERFGEATTLMIRTLQRHGLPPAMIEVVVGWHQCRAGVQALITCLIEAGMIPAEKFMTLQAENVENALERLQDRITSAH